MRKLSLLVLVFAVGGSSLAAGQDIPLLTDRLAGLAEMERTGTAATAVVAAATTRCPVSVLSPVVTILEAQSPLNVAEQLHGGAFISAARVDAEDPRDGRADTDWVAASWASPAGILWGRDYAPDNVFEGIVRLLDNRRARINAYTMSFASLTPRLVLTSLTNQDTEDGWMLVSVDGVIVGIPGADGFDRIGWPLCASGLFFVGDAFDDRGFVPAKHLRQ